MTIGYSFLHGDNVVRTEDVNFITSYQMSSLHLNTFKVKFIYHLFMVMK